MATPIMYHTSPPRVPSCQTWNSHLIANLVYDCQRFVSYLWMRCGQSISEFSGLIFTAEFRQHNDNSQYTLLAINIFYVSKVWKVFKHLHLMIYPYDTLFLAHFIYCCMYSFIQYQIQTLIPLQCYTLILNSANQTPPVLRKEILL